MVYEFLRLINSPDIATMDALYIYLAVPLTCGIPSYVIPNMFLNKEKVRQNYIPDYDKTVLGGEYADEDGIGTERNIEDGLYSDTEAYPTQPGDTGLSDF